MDLTRIAQSVLDLCQAEGLELTDDLRQVEATLTDLTRQIEAAAIETWRAPPAEVQPKRLYVAVDGTMVHEQDG